MDVIEHLRKNQHLATLNPVDLESLAEACLVTRYAPGHTVFVEGDHPHGVHLVLTGMIEVSRKERARAHRGLGLGPGALFGMMALLQGTPRSATCTATVESEVALIPREAVLLLFNQSAPIAYAFQKALAAQMARDLRANDQRLRELLARSPSTA